MKNVLRFSYPSWARNEFKADGLGSLNVKRRQKRRGQIFDDYYHAKFKQTDKGLEVELRTNDSVFPIDSFNCLLRK